jgi:alkylation response protein AidB-like acyl-CoA dehydrogenase
MHLAFTSEQRQFGDAVRQVLSKECTPSDARAAFASPRARSGRWATLAEMGVVGLCLPEADGGLGLGLLDLVLVLEEAGRVALPEPLADTAALAAPLLTEVPSPDRTAPLREAIASGQVAACVAEVIVAGAVADTAAAGVPVAGADGADLLIVAAPVEDGWEIHAVPSEQVEVTPVSSLDPTRRLGIPAWTPVPDTCVASGPAAAAALTRTADRGAVATAAQLLGLADRMIGMTADYAKARHQFGQPIGSFQAVKHHLAGAQVKLEFARPAVYAAAWSLDQGEPTASRASSTAKALASDAATEAARVALQVHGAIGYTWECDLHLFLKRTWALAAAWGSAGDHRLAVLDSLTGSA